MEKSFISLFMITPVSGTISWDPKRVLIVDVMAMVRPDLSLVTEADVPSSWRIS